MDAGATEGMAGGLRWLSATLGEVRDLQVLKARLLEDADGFEGALAPLFSTLDRRDADARDALLAAFRGDRYREIVARLSVLAPTPCRPTWRPSPAARRCLPWWPSPGAS